MSHYKYVEVYKHTYAGQHFSFIIQQKRETRAIQPKKKKKEKQGLLWIRV